MARGLKIADLAFLGNVGAGGSFTPPDLANLFFWVKPETLSALNDNDPITVWPDSSPAGNDMTATGGTVFRTNQLNGVGGASFDGIDDNLVSMAPTVPVHTNYTLFIVARHNSAAGTGTMIEIGNLAGYVLLKDTGNREIVHRAIAALVDAAATTSAELWTARKTGVPLTTLRVNGSAVGLTNSASLVTAPDAAITIGEFLGAGLRMDGFIFEIMAWSTDLSDADRDTVETYLRAKYNL